MSAERKTSKDIVWVKLDVEFEDETLEGWGVLFDATTRAKLTTGKVQEIIGALGESTAACLDQFGLTCENGRLFLQRGLRLVQ